MKKYDIFAAIAVAITLTSTSAFAEQDMEKCKVIKDGKGLIKENKADCNSEISSCAGQNKAGDPEAWIIVPKGQCAKINAGDFSGVSQNIKDRIDTAPLENKNLK